MTDNYCWKCKGRIDDYIDGVKFIDCLSCGQTSCPCCMKECSLCKKEDSCKDCFYEFNDKKWGDYLDFL